MYLFTDIRRQLAVSLVIGSSLSLIVPCQSQDADEENKVHEQQLKTSEHDKVVGSNYSYPVVGVDDRKLAELTTTQLTPKRQAPQAQSPSTNKCMPKLGSLDASKSTGRPFPSLAALTANVSFPVRNIKMPSPSASGALGSALKLLSTLDRHLNGDYNAEGDDEDDYDGEEDDADEIEGYNVGDNLARFRNNKLRIQGLELTMLNVHIFTDDEPRMSLGITIKNTSLTGRFIYEGPTLMGDAKLKGYYRMLINNIYLVASSSLTKKVVDADKNQCDLVTNEFKLDIANLGYISIDIFDTKDLGAPTSNYLLRMLSSLLQRTIKRTYYTFEAYIKETLERQSKKFIDCELTRFSPMLKLRDGNKLSSSEFSHADLASIVNGEIERSKMGSVVLPNFHYENSIFGHSANIHFDGGSLSGLNHLVLDGSGTRVKLEDEHLIVNASIGWRHLRAYYNWKLYTGSSGGNKANTPSDRQQKSPAYSGFVAFNIKAVSIQT